MLEVHPSFLLLCHFPSSLQLWLEASAVDAIFLPLFLLVSVFEVYTSETMLLFIKFPKPTVILIIKNCFSQ